MNEMKLVVQPGSKKLAGIFRPLGAESLDFPAEVGLSKIPVEMQTKKRVSGRNTSQEVASPMVSRTQRKAVENAKVGEVKASELITSSARKPQCGSLPKKNEEPAVSNLNSRCNLVQEGTSDASSLSYEKYGKGYHDGVAQRNSETIFSPSFHISKASETDFTRGGNFTHKSQIRDQKVHDYSQGDDPSIDADGEINKETFESSFRADKKHGVHSFTSGTTACHSDVEMHTGISYHCGDQILSMDTSGMNSSCIVGSDGTILSSEVSAIYLAMKNSKLECLDEHGQDSIPVDVCLDEDDDNGEFDDFDPYLFIKNLPELSSVVPTFRPVLLPKQTRSCPPTTLVLDLDETLVHSTLEPCDDADFTFPVSFNLQEYTVYVRCRPYLRDFMERVSSLFEIVIFTASRSIYAEQLLNVLDPKRKVFRHRVYRESCVYVEGNYLKDLSVLGRDLAHVIIVDNSPQAFGFQVDNGIPIETWFDDRSDQELLLLIPFLESLVGVEDVRPLIARKYNLREKIAAAVYPPLSSDRGDPFER